MKLPEKVKSKVIAQLIELKRTLDEEVCPCLSDIRGYSKLGIPLQWCYEHCPFNEPNILCSEFSPLCLRSYIERMLQQLGGERDANKAP